MWKLGADHRPVGRRSLGARRRSICPRSVWILGLFGCGETAAEAVRGAWDTARPVANANDAAPGAAEPGPDAAVPGADGAPTGPDAVVPGADGAPTGPDAGEPWTDGAPTGPDAAEPGTDAAVPIRADAAPGHDAAVPLPWDPRSFCGHQWPLQVRVVAGDETEPLFARVWVEGATPGPGADPRLRVFVGYAAQGALPDAGRFTWTEAVPNPACQGCGADNDEYMARLVAPRPGRYDLAWRLERAGGSDLHCDRADGDRRGSDDGYHPADAARMDVVDGDTLTLATLNLRCPRTWDDWDARRALVVAGLAAVHADAFALQEVCSDFADVPNGRDTLTELVGDLNAATGQVWQVARVNVHVGWDHLDEGLAVLSPHRILDQGAVELPSPPGAQVFARKAILARIAAPTGEFVLAATHLAFEHTPGGEAARLSQLDGARAALEGFRRADEPTFLAGDLNEGPDGQAVQTMLAAGYRDTWGGLEPNAEGFTYPADAPIARIDHLLQRIEPAGVRPVSVQQFLDTPIGGVWPSDHRGVWATYRTQAP